MSGTTEGVYDAVRRSLAMLEKKARLRFFALVLLRASLAIVDLATVSLLSALVINGMMAGSRTGLLFLRFPDSVSGVYLLSIFALIVLLSLFRGLASLAIHRKTLNLLAAQENRIGRELTTRIFSRDVGLLREFETPQVVYVLTSGINAGVTRLLGNVSTVFAELTSAVLLVFFGFALNPVGTSVTLLLVVVFYHFSYRGLNERLYRIGGAYASSVIHQGAGIRELIEGARELRSMSAQAPAEESLGNIREVATKQSADLNFVVQIPRILMEVGILVMATIVGLIELARPSGGEPLEAIGLFLATGFRIGPAVLALQNAVGGVRQASGESKSASNLISQLGEYPVANVSAQLSADQSMRGSHDSGGVALSLRGLALRYPGTDRDVFSNVSLDVLPGERLALVGPSGAGKSSLIDTILGLATPTQGEVLVDGLTLMEFQRHRPHDISYVPQYPAILRGTILSNLLFHVAQESPEAIARAEAVLRETELWDYVCSLPDGLHTSVGESGSTLSGGQRQRLGIARALFHRPRLLILDEPTSALDDETSELVSRNLFRRPRDCTILVVAHRLSTIQDCDRVLKMDDGAIHG